MILATLFSIFVRTKGFRRFQPSKKKRLVTLYTVSSRMPSSRKAWLVTPSTNKPNKDKNWKITNAT